EYQFRIVLSEAIDIHRSSRSLRLREMKAAERVEVQPVEIDVDVLGAVERLSVQQRSAVYLTYWADLPPDEVAARMGISTGAVKRHLARARKRLGERLACATRRGSRI